MQKIIGLAIGAVAMVALSGCNMVPGTTSTGDNIKIERQTGDYTKSYSDNKTCVEVKNNTTSDYDLYDIWSAPDGGTYSHIFPNGTLPNEIQPGEKRTFCSSNCGADTWKIKVEDARSAVAEGTYQRECGYKELLVVTTTI